MTAVAKALVRGACPGALQPMQSGDGLIVRVRPRAARLTLEAAASLAEAAARFGNGEIDLTRRANVQIRGVRAETLEPLQRVIAALGLLDASAAEEAVRNIVVNPLAGIDPAERFDAMRVALDLEGRLTADERLWRLPAKFGFVVDGGGVVSLAAERADIRIAAVEVNGESHAALGIDGPRGIRWLGSVTRDTAAEAAAIAALSMLSPVGPAKRTVAVDASAVARMTQALGPLLQPFGVAPNLSPATKTLGAIMSGGREIAIGLGAPFGRVDSAMLTGLANAAASAGASEVRVSPWRSIYLPHQRSVGALIEAAHRLGFVTATDDPLMQIEACPGAPACQSAAFDTRATALRVAALLPSLSGVASVHVSGCAKGCACSRPADLVLVGAGPRMGIVRNGRADDPPAASIGAANIADLPSILLRTPRHGG